MALKAGRGPCIWDTLGNIAGNATADVTVDEYHRYKVHQLGRIGMLLDFVWFLHPITYGEYPKTMQEVVKERLPKFTCEEVGMARSDWIFIVPWGMYKAVTNVKETYGNPTIIPSENGKYIVNLKKAIDNGANVVGYFVCLIISSGS
ncbi:putative Beta-glucosidase 44 [Cocos nucifera]|uniref:Putative Beta-glucosidase 44 n=1 Tax=Cocos nucifera TaxID=13894 RepID=A0A8K0MYT3_COCNU|nr:putative Beta-glucosidase 44 [Cocos nucifera]